MVDPDLNYFKNLNIETNDFSPIEAKTHLAKCKNKFSLLNINTRSISKNFENLKTMLCNLKFNFKIICVTETWLKEHMVTNSNFNIPGYKSIHQPRSGNRTGGGTCLFLHNSINYKLRSNLSINTDDCESLTVELINQNTRNIIVTVMYRKPAGIFKEFKRHFKSHLTKLDHLNKHIYIAGDLNLNILEYTSKNEVKTFVDTLLQHNLIPTITKPTRVTLTSATIIDNIITNNFHNNEYQTGVIETDVSDHFPTFLLSDESLPDKLSAPTIFKREINECSIEKFRQSLLEANWELVSETENLNGAYDVFLRMFINLYEKSFPKKKVSIKTSTLENPWITKGLIKSSKKKQRLYEAFLKKRTYTNENKYKNYKNTF